MWEKNFDLKKKFLQVLNSWGKKFRNLGEQIVTLKHKLSPWLNCHLLTSQKKLSPWSTFSILPIVTMKPWWWGYYALVVAVAPRPVEVDPHLANVYLVPPRHVCIAFPAVRVVPVSFRIYVCAGLPKPDPYRLHGHDCITINGLQLASKIRHFVHNKPHVGVTIWPWSGCLCHAGLSGGRSWEAYLEAYITYQCRIGSITPRGVW